MAKNRPSPCREFQLFDDDNSRGWRKIVYISFEEGLEAERNGAVRVADAITGKLVGWQCVAEKKKNILDAVDPLGRETHELMNVAEIHLVAGLRGRSRTMGMDLNDPRRLILVDKHGKPVHPEDPIERATEKCKILGEERLPVPVRSSNTWLRYQQRRTRRKKKFKPQLMAAD